MPIPVANLLDAAAFVVSGPPFLTSGTGLTSLPSISVILLASISVCSVISSWYQQSDEERQEHEDRYRKLIEMSPEMIFVIKSNRIIFMNQTGLDLVGAASLPQVQGRSPFDFVHTDFQPLVQQRLDLLDKTTTVRLSELKLVRLDGTPIDVEIVASSGQERGAPVIHVFCHSIAKQRWLAENMDGAEEPPYRSLKTEAIGRLAAEIAHDFNNLIMVLTSYIETLESSESVSPQLRELSSDIRKTADDLGELARRLLLFGRNEPIAPQVLNLNKLVSGFQRMLKQAVGVRVQLVTTLAAQTGMIQADRTQLEQILLNLAVNARDAMPEGGTLTIETKNVALTEDEVQLLPGRRAASFVSLVVRDTGVGMDETTKPLIFEPYFTTKPPGNGTGMGLASVFNLVRRNGGFIRFDSQPGQGTSFILHFPSAAPSPSGGHGAETPGALPSQ